MPLSGRAVLVTGAGRGLGRAYAVAIAAQGAGVVVNDVDVESAHSTVSMIAAAGGTAVAAPGSVADHSSAQVMVEACTTHFGRIDALVNNAAINSQGAPESFRPEDIDRFLAVNVRGVLLMGIATIAAMRRRNDGVIINVTSGAHIGLADMSLYAATKGAVASLTYAWALDLAGTGIRVLGVSPWAATSMALKPETMPSPDRIAPVVAYLVGSGSRGLSGQVVRWDGTRLSLLRPPSFAGPFVESDGSQESIARAFDTQLRPGAWPVGMAGRDLSEEIRVS